MDVILGLVMLAAMGYGAYRAVRFAVEKVQQHRGLTEEQRAYRQRLKGAEKGLKRTTKEHDKRVAATRRALDQATNPKPIAAYGAIRLYEDRIDLGAQGTHPLTPAVVADVDTAGNLMQKHRSTVTRMGIGTLAAGPIGLLVGAAAKKSTDVDTRELWLTVTGPNFGTVVKANPDAGMQVRSLAQQICLAAHNVGQATANRQKLIAATRATLTRVESERRASVETAQRQLDAARADDPDPRAPATTGTPQPA